MGQAGVNLHGPTQCAVKAPRRSGVRGTSARITGAASVKVPRSRGLHSSTSQLNLNRFRRKTHP